MNAITFLVAVLDSLWQAAVLAALVWFALKLAPRMNAATRFAIWWAVLIAVMALPFAPPLIDSFRESVKPATLKAARPLYAAPAAPAADLPPLVTLENRTPMKWPLWIEGLWGLIFAFRSGQLIRSYLYLRKAKMRSAVSNERLPPLRRSARLLLSREIDSPIAVGFVRPAIILPAGLSRQLLRDEMDHVLLHEAAHLARWDDWTNLLARILGAALALHPVALWILSRIETERERACDDWVVSRTQAIRPYVNSLAKLYELRFAPKRAMREQPLAAGMFGGSRLVDRIEALLARGSAFNDRVSLVRLAAGCVGLLALIAVTSLSPRWIAFAQPARPAFDVASIKRHPEGSPGVTFSELPGGRLTVVNNPVANIIRNAYGIAPYQLIGAPEWVDSERYDIEAKGAEKAARKEIMLMTQSLLADRFDMKAHFDTREMSAYILTVAKGGSKLKILSAEDCTPFDGTKADAQAASNVCGNNLVSRDNNWTATHISMRGVTGVLSRSLRGPVIDRTGIKGTFDVSLRWTEDVAPPDSPDAPPSVATAVHEGLGLDLKSGRGPVEVLVIDHIERPRGN